jgi:hypothetical protein
VSKEDPHDAGIVAKLNRAFELMEQLQGDQGDEGTQGGGGATDAMTPEEIAQMLQRHFLQTDNIILDDFKTELDKLSRHKMSRILPVDAILNAENLSDNHHNWQKRVSWLTGSDDPCAERVEDVRRRDSGREVIRYPPRALWSTQASSSAQR